MFTGLFHRAIPASGSGVNYWATQSSERSYHNSKKLARLLGASEDDITDPIKRIQFLRKADAGEMSRRASEVVGNEVQIQFYLSFSAQPILNTQSNCQN